ncbi:MAG: hypothetical protein QXS20_10510 [Candidatus Thorarchaeota archaeon]
MNQFLLIAMILLIAIVVVACYVRRAVHAILLLSVGSVAVTVVPLAENVAAYLALPVYDNLLKFLVSVLELLIAAVVTPGVFYLGVRKTLDVVDTPRIGYRNTTVVVIVLIVLHLATWVVIQPILMMDLTVLGTVILGVSVSLLMIAIRDDPFKIMVGLNMAETALFPYLEKTPMAVVPGLLVLIVFVNVVGTYIIYHSYLEYGVMSVDEWRKMTR